MLECCERRFGNLMS